MLLANNLIKRCKINLKKKQIMIYRDSLDKIFDSFFNNYIDYGTLTDTKSVKLKSDDENYKVIIAIPGLTKEDIKISIKDGLLSVSFDGLEKNSDLIFVEKFKKTYTIPEDADEKTINAKVDNGVLSIILPKGKKKTSERLIAIH